MNHGFRQSHHSRPISTTLVNANPVKTPMVAFARFASSRSAPADGPADLRGNQTCGQQADGRAANDNAERPTSLGDNRLGKHCGEIERCAPSQDLSDAQRGNDYAPIKRPRVCCQIQNAQSLIRWIHAFGFQHRGRLRSGKHLDQGLRCLLVLSGST